MKRENQTRQPAQVFKKETNTKKETKDLKRDNERVAANERRGERERQKKGFGRRGVRERVFGRCFKCVLYSRPKDESNFSPSF